MHFLHHYLQKGFKLEYLLELDYWTKQFMSSSLDIVLEEEQKKEEQRNKLLEAKVFPVVAF